MDSVGQVSRSSACPIAKFLVSTGAEMVNVEEDRIIYYRNHRPVEFRPPAWARRFIDQIDRDYYAQPVPASRALSVLREVA
jgi:hypothetical protein